MTPLWQEVCARFMPPVASNTLPAGLLERFSKVISEAMLRLLVFLTPITVRPVTLNEGC